MRLILCIVLLGLGACAQPSAGIDWTAWTTMQEDLGLMRRDRAADDYPVDNALISKHFESIAFGLEPDPFGTGAATQHTDGAAVLHRWSAPIRLTVVSLEQPSRAHSRIKAYLARLQEVTRHSLTQLDDSASTEDERPNLMVIYANDTLMQSIVTDLAPKDPADADERAAVEWLRQQVATWRVAPSPCAGSFFVQKNPDKPDLGTIMFAMVMIRTEMPDTLLEACIEEELAQTMGLPNDDPAVKPSIFNDDQEFALLTDHDAMLLRILYDKRLQPGMTAEVAMPLVRQIIAEQRPSS